MFEFPVSISRDHWCGALSNPFVQMAFGCTALGIRLANFLSAASLLAPINNHRATHRSIDSNHRHLSSLSPPAAPSVFFVTPSCAADLLCHIEQHHLSSQLNQLHIWLRAAPSVFVVATSSASCLPSYCRQRYLPPQQLHAVPAVAVPGLNLDQRPISTGSKRQWRHPGRFWRLPAETTSDP